MTTFRVGEVARFVADKNTLDIPSLSFDGCEVIVTDTLRAHKSVINGQLAGDFYSYEVATSSGLLLLVEPHELRKKQPPRSAKAIMREAILKAKQPCEVPA